MALGLKRSGLGLEDLAFASTPGLSVTCNKCVYGNHMCIVFYTTLLCHCACTGLSI